MIEGLVLAQNPVVNELNGLFTKDQMYQDFDSLVSTITRVSPHILIKKDLWHYDAKKQMVNFRRSIDTISSDLSFYLLLESTLNLALDLHTSILRQESEWALIQYNRIRKVRNSFKFSIGNVYINGKYYTTDPFVINGDTIQIGSQITHINNEEIDKYVKKRLHTTDGIAYDIINKKFYYPGIFKNNETLFQDSIKVTFRRQDYSKAYTVSTHKYTKYLPSTHFIDSTRVEYWEKERIVYIRLTDMDPEVTPIINAGLSGIKSKEFEVNKVIIDIRENGGGQDNVWQNLFAELVANPIVYYIEIDDYNNSVLKKDKMESYGYIDLNIEKERNPLLRKYNYYRVLSTKEVIEPTPKSLKYTGKIYLLAENHYSSAGSAVSVASSDKCDNLISVGRRSGYFMGIGFSPVKYELPNSKLLFRVAPTIEVTNINNLCDLMQDKFEIEVPYDLQYYHDKFKYKGKPTDKDFLIEYDPFIKAVLNN